LQDRPPRTLTELLLRAGDGPEVGLRVLDRHGTPTWTAWPVVLERARGACACLQDLGVRRGDRVALLYPTRLEFLDALFGVVLAGAIPVPLYPPVRFGRLDEYHQRTARMLEAVDARLVLADGWVRAVIGDLIDRVHPPLGCHTLTRLPGHGAEPVEVDPDDLALVQFSSGTTRDPKPVALTHRAVVAQAALLNAFWPDTDGTRNSGVSWLPLYHDMGLIGCVFAALERPGTLTLIPPEVFVTRPAVWLQTISRFRATVSPAPNFAYSLCTERIRDEEMEGVDLSSWRVALCGAETVVADVMRAFADRFARWGFRPDALTPVYGLSEAALAVTFTDPGRGMVSRRFDRRALAAGIARETDDGREIVSMGRPVPGFSLRIEDDYGNMMCEGKVGRVLCQGPSLMNGYLGYPEATAQAMRGGWLDTGDAGFLSRGELFLAGRRKDILLIRGSNHSPEEVEGAAQAAAGVRAGCVVAVSWLPEGADGERLLVLAEARRNTGASRFPAIAHACRESILKATGLVAERVIVLPAGTLPRTSSGKLRRQDALLRYQTGDLTRPRMARWRLAAAVARSGCAYLRTLWRGARVPT
jgi:acyl-CoA synthetase (AMP-forming)/AMP-acid ligase II